jgi:hypothetical protein
VARVRVVQKVLYAEAVKKVEEDGSGSLWVVHLCQHRGIGQRVINQSNKCIYKALLTSAGAQRTVQKPSLKPQIASKWFKLQ